MAMFNNQVSFMDENNSFGRQQYGNNSPSDSYQTLETNQVMYSTLQPTAAEFQPLNSSNGAIKKEPQRNSSNKYDCSKPNYYGSGRTFSNSRGYRHTHERSKDKPFFSRDNLSGPSQSHSANNTQNVFKKTSDFRNTFSNYEEEKSHVPITNSSFSNYSSDHQIGSNLGSRAKLRNNSQRNFSKQKVHEFNSSYNNSQSFTKSHWPSKSSPSYSFKKSYNNKKMTFNKNKDRSRIDSLNNVKENQTDFEDVDHRIRESENHKYQFSNKLISNFANSKYNRKNINDVGNRTSFRRNKYSKKVDASSQKERLEEMIYNRMLECLVCCEKIKNNDKIWSCQLCYHILHLHCIIAWAKSSKLENGWRCPACQNVCNEIPNTYKCYCGKTVEPKNSPSTIAHGCGEICLRKGRTCDHKCTLLCHPGPCPDCNIMVSKACGCGATSPVVKCSAGVEIVCNNRCNKLLECGLHRCTEICHSGNCDMCTKVIHQECYCGKVGRKVFCSAQYNGKTNYECGEVCGKQLSCGNHTCKKLCHEGPCEKCTRDIKKLFTCPCGKTPLDKERTSCLDPVPCCDKICGKQLKCGQPGLRHNCSVTCHENDCPPCSLTSVVKCRCGHMDKELPCQNIISNPDDTKCEKKCTKKRLCGKHKCNQRCCIEVEHICPLPCNHLLSCGQHRCERTCHSGRCPQCMETSFEELYCECGGTVLYPPIPCGTKPPACQKPCSRPRNCEHNVNHNCHTGPCPPCTVLCKKWCYGHHEQRSAILCHQDSFSCGLPCGKAMPCGRHKCNKPCHNGPCPVVCNQPCTTPRRLCGHICGKPCHNPPCPESGCKQKVPVTCSCGYQKSTKLCIEVDDEFKNIEMAQLKEKMGVSSKDHAVDISDIISNVAKPSILKILECNEECRVIERNRRLAIGLQIVNPDLSQKLTPKYSDFMRQWAKKDANFCQRVHNKLTDLVQLAKQSKQKSRSYSFESMNKDKRNFVHEYCEHFGVESAAYDSEPNRNVVATAIRDKSWLPSMSLLEVIQRENGQRKVPGPISVSAKGGFGKSETVSLKLPSRSTRPVSPHRGEVDT